MIRVTFLGTTAAASPEWLEEETQTRVARYEDHALALQARSEVLA